MNNRSSLGIFLIAVAFFVGLAVGSSSNARTGGVNVEGEDFTQGFTINGTAFVSNDRAVTATDLSASDDAVISDDLTVAGDTVVKQFTQGGGILRFTATSTQSARTLTAAELLASNVIEITATNSPALVLTLPATSTMTTLLPNAGDTRTWFIDNQQAAATTTTITAGTGIDLVAYTTNDDVIDGLEIAELTCWRKFNTDVYCITTEILKAD